MEVKKAEKKKNAIPNLLCLNLIKFLFIKIVKNANSGIIIVRLINTNKPNKNKYFDSNLLFLIVLLRIIKR